MSKHTIKRYDWTDGCMEECASGDYVEYADVKPLIDALAGRDPAALGELERAVERLAHWSRQYMTETERKFGPQPKYGSGIVGSLNSSIEEANTALAAFRKENT